MFDVYEFFNSADMAKYLKDVDWKFTPLEKAWIVYKSTKKPYLDKKKVWCEIIKQSDDFLIKKRNCLLEKDIMFHDALKQYMDYKDNCIEKLKSKEEGWIYHYSSKRKIVPGDSYCNGSIDRGNVYFSNFDECYEFCRTQLDFSEVDSYNIKKIKLNDISESMGVRAHFDKSGILLDTYCDSADEITGFFESLWFAFPTPFKNGDIVCNATFDYLSDNVFIFVRCHNNEDETRREYRLKHSDITDMTFSAYELTKDGRLFWDVNWCYTDLEYYRGDFSGVKNILRIASEYIKGEIPIDLFINAYTDNFLDKIKDDLKNEYSLFLSESLERIGKKREDYVD